MSPNEVTQKFLQLGDTIQPSVKIRPMRHILRKLLNTQSREAQSSALALVLVLHKVRNHSVQ